MICDVSYSESSYFCSVLMLILLCADVNFALVLMLICSVLMLSELILFCFFLDLIVCSPRDNETQYIGRVYLYSVSTLGTLQTNSIAEGNQVIN